jgi:N-acetylglucosamine-6-sulfatase
MRLELRSLARRAASRLASAPAEEKRRVPGGISLLAALVLVSGLAPSASASLRTAPQSKIDSGPSGPTNNPTPTFTFSSSKPRSSFQCRIDSRAFAACRSPKTTRQLAAGPHAFRVRAVDRAGNADPSPAVRRFTVRPAPNVVVIETDDQTVESMRVMEKVNSLIGAQGVTFANSFVNFSLCCPSRATFLTGQYAHNHGVISNTAPEGGFERFQSLHGGDNLAVWLQEAGYYTAMIGKYLNGYINDPPVPLGWSEWHAALPDDQKVYDYFLSANGTVVRHGHEPTDFKQDVLTRKAVSLVNRRAPKPRPFFLWLTYTAPHVGSPDPSPLPPSDCQGAPKPAPRHATAFDSEPLPMPPSFNEADVSDKPGAIQGRELLGANEIADMQRRYRCELESLLAVDEGVERLIEALRANRALHKTLVIYTSDNGRFHGEHRIAGGKQGSYEESIRVPLLIRGPRIPRGISIDPLVVNADLAPTIVEVASAARPGLTMDGRSLIPVLKQATIGGNRELLIQGAGVKAIRTERYMYAEHSTGERELYDLGSDPFQLQSLDTSPAHAGVRAQLADRLHQLEGCAGASCRVYRPDPSP